MPTVLALGRSDASVVWARPIASRSTGSAPQLDDAIASLVIELTDDDIAEVEAPYVPRRATEVGRPSLRP